MKYIYFIGVASIWVQSGHCAELFLSTSEGIYMKLPCEVSFALTTHHSCEKTIFEQNIMQLLLHYLKEMQSITKEHPRFLWTKKIAELLRTTTPEELTALIELAVSLNQIEIAHGIARQYIDQEIPHSFDPLDEIPESVEQIIRKQYFLRTHNAAILSYTSRACLKQIKLSFSLKEILCTIKTPLNANKLDLSHLHIGSLEGIQALDHPLIFNIDLSHNDLEQLPEEIGILTHLTHLNLSFNALEKIPDSIGNLHNLIRLDVQHNQLRCLPFTIKNLTRLSQVRCKHNPALAFSRADLPESVTLFDGEWLN